MLLKDKPIRLLAESLGLLAKFLRLRAKLLGLLANLLSSSAKLVRPRAKLLRLLADKLSSLAKRLNHEDFLPKRKNGFRAHIFPRRNYTRKPLACLIFEH